MLNLVSTTPQVNTNSSKMNEWSLPDKHKVLELIKVELNKLKIQLNQLQLKAGHGSTMTSAEISQEQNQIKERYILLVKKQSEIQVLINQHDSTKQVVTSTLPNPAKNSNSIHSAESGVRWSALEVCIWYCCESRHAPCHALEIPYRKHSCLHDPLPGYKLHC